MMAKNNYEVGYGRPPKDTQFKKGQSGNPAGRPKGTRNFKTDLEEELQERVRITEGGKSEEVSKQRALVKRTFEKGINGDMLAVAMIAQWVMQHLGISEGTPEAEDLKQDDKAIIDGFLKSIETMAASESADDDDIQPSKSTEETP
jgi:hypothetical protein